MSLLDWDQHTPSVGKQRFTKLNPRKSGATLLGWSVSNGTTDPAPLKRALGGLTWRRCAVASPSARTLPSSGARTYHEVRRRCAGWRRPVAGEPNGEGEGGICHPLGVWCAATRQRRPQAVPRPQAREERPMSTVIGPSGALIAPPLLAVLLIWLALRLARTILRLVVVVLVVVLLVWGSTQYRQAVEGLSIRRLARGDTGSSRPGPAAVQCAGCGGPGPQGPGAGRTRSSHDPGDHHLSGRESGARAHA
jgi:hypothetical protein